jgi:hypothetical protein
MIQQFEIYDSIGESCYVKFIGSKMKHTFDMKTGKNYVVLLHK